MASIEKRGGSFRLILRHRGVKYATALNVKTDAEARFQLRRVELNLERLNAGLLTVPTAANFLDFLLERAEQKKSPIDNVAPAFNPLSLTMPELFQAYFAALPDGNLEKSTIRTMKLDQAQLQKHFGKDFLLAGMNTAALQKYIAARSKQSGRHGRNLSPITIKKAIVSLRTAWNWARQQELLDRPFPSRGLRYPKGREKSPFMTFAEVSRRAAKLSPAESLDLWETCFLSLQEIEELLAIVKKQGRHKFIYPFFLLAAHTGARRSEIVRSKLSDLDFESNLITFHERKKSHEKLTTRQVPMSPLLPQVLKEWLAVHPGGEFTICQAEKVWHSRKFRDRPLPLTGDEAHDHFKRTLAGTKFEKLRGWHCLRHSFCSNSAAQGIDQRIINAWVGHMSDDMVRRYRHLLPDQNQQAILAVFKQTSPSMGGMS